MDWLHIENLTHAFLCAIDKLSDEYNPRKHPCGQAYFISDGTPIDNFEFFRPLLEAREEAFPVVVLPVTVALAVGWVCETLHKKLGIPPFLTRAEVYKVRLVGTLPLSLVGYTHTYIYIIYFHFSTLNLSILSYTHTRWVALTGFR